MKIDLKMLVLPLAFACGCGVTPSEEGTVGSVQAGLTPSFAIDSTAVAAHPGAVLPQGLLTLRAFDDAMIARALVQSSDPFTPGYKVGTRVELDSANWRVEKDPQLGAVLVVAKNPSGPAVVQDERALEVKATQRLLDWGVGKGEMGKVLQRHAMVQDQDGNKSDVPSLHRYKTFVFRAINGVPVEGHRAVVTHGLDGEFKRAFVRWPALAAQGHKLRTALTTAEIEKAAVAALVREGESTGNARLHWKYVPVEQPSGEVTLTLAVGARLDGVSNIDGINEEAREIDVDVQAQ